MTPAAFLAKATADVCAATGADPEVVRERLSQAVQILVLEGLDVEPANARPSHLRIVQRHDDGCACPECDPEQLGDEPEGDGCHAFALAYLEGRY